MGPVLPGNRYSVPPPHSNAKFKVVADAPVRLVKAVLQIGILAVGGCNVIGPTAIRNGRLAYNDAIIATNSQQVLATIVRMRYGEPTGLLTVSSVTANMRHPGQRRR